MMKTEVLPRQGGWGRGVQWSWGGLVPDTGADARAILVLQANTRSGALRFTFFLQGDAEPSVCATGLVQLSSSLFDLAAVRVGPKGARWDGEETVFVHSRVALESIERVFESFDVLADILASEDVFSLFCEPGGTRIALKVRGLLPSVLFAERERRALMEEAALAGDVGDGKGGDVGTLVGA